MERSQQVPPARKRAISGRGDLSPIKCQSQILKRRLTPLKRAGSASTTIIGATGWGHDVRIKRVGTRATQEDFTHRTEPRDDAIVLLVRLTSHWTVGEVNYLKPGDMWSRWHDEFITGVNQGSSRRWGHCIYLIDANPSWLKGPKETLHRFTRHPDRRGPMDGNGGGLSISEQPWQSEKNTRTQLVTIDSFPNQLFVREIGRASG